MREAETDSRERLALDLDDRHISRSPETRDRKDRGEQIAVAHIGEAPLAQPRGEVGRAAGWTDDPR